MSLIEVNGTALYYERRGDGPAITVFGFRGERRRRPLDGGRRSSPRPRTGKKKKRAWLDSRIAVTTVYVDEENFGDLG